MKRLSGGPSPDTVRELRRLLPVIVLLIVAIVAVPKLLKGSPPEPLVQTELSAGLAKIPDLSPVVLAEETFQMRDFRKRLREANSKNPFHQPAVPEPEGAGATAESDSADVTGSSIDDLSSITSPISDPVAGSEVVAPIEEPAPPGETTTTPDPVDPVPDPVPEDPPAGDEGTRLISTRIDVRVGPVGATQVVEDVKSLTFLPDAERPVVSYLRGEFDLTSALFIVSPGVVSTEGEGNCAPAVESCEFLELQVGQEQSFEYTDGVRYRLKLLEVTLHEDPLAETDAPADEARSSEGFSASEPFGWIISG